MGRSRLCRAARRFNKATDRWSDDPEANRPFTRRNTTDVADINTRTEVCGKTLVYSCFMRHQAANTDNRNLMDFMDLMDLITAANTG